MRTEQQIDKIIEECAILENSIILYTIVETKLAKYISKQSEKKNVPCLYFRKLNFKLFKAS